MNELTRNYMVRVRFGETDAAGIVFYPNFFMYFDLATQELFRRAPGDWVADMRATGLGFPIMESGGKFLAPLFHDDEIAIVSRVVDVRTRAFRIEHEIARGETRVAHGFEVRAYACKDPLTKKLEMQPFGDELRAWLLGGRVE